MTSAAKFKTEDGQTLVLATPRRRLVGRLIDLVLLIGATTIAVGLGLGGTVLSALRGDAAGIGIAVGTLVVTIVVAGVLVLFAVIYEGVMIARTGRTVGKRLVGVKVVRRDNGERPGWASSLARWAVPYLLLLVPVVGWVLSLVAYISLLWDPQRQGWHDRLASTLVVRTEPRTGG